MMRSLCRVERNSRAGSRAGWPVIAAVIAALAPMPAAAAEPVALVVDMDGRATTPPIAPFTEVVDGAAFTLPSRGRLTFLHYRNCEEVTVEGGTILFRSESFRLVGGAIVNMVSRPCPAPVAANGSTGIGGVLLRGDPTVAVPARPRFLLTGARADAVTGLTVADDDGIVASSSLSEQGFDWPAVAAPLRVGQGYDLTLVSARGQAIETVRITRGRAVDGVVVLRVE